MNTQRMPQVNVIFLCTNSDRWELRDPETFHQIKKEVESLGGKFWYLGQKNDCQATRDQQYLDITQFITQQGHRYDMWEILKDEKNPALTAEQKFFMTGIQEMMQHYIDGRIGYVSADWEGNPNDENNPWWHRAFPNSVRQSIAFVIDPEKVIREQLERINQHDN